MNVVAGPPIESLVFLLSLAQADQLSFFQPGQTEQYRPSRPPHIPACDK